VPIPPDRRAADLERIAQHLPDPVVVVDSSASVVWANRAALHLFDRTAEQAVGLEALELVHPDDLSLALVCLESVQGRESGTPIELRVSTAEGWRLVELVGAPVDDCIAITMRDLTERRRWEIASNDEDRFRSILQNAAAVTMLLDEHWRVEASSAALTRLLGWDPEHLEGRSFHEFLDQADADQLDDVRARFIAGETRGVIDVAVRTSGGPAVPVTIYATNLLDDPTTHGVVLTIHDVSRRVVAEEELHAANSLLAATLDATAEGVLVLDAHGAITLCNERFAEMWGLGADFDAIPAEQRSLRHVVGRLRDPEEFLARVMELQRQPDRETHDIVEFADGRIFERDSRPRRLDGHVVGRVWSFRDITAHRMLQKELARQAAHDPLTGLANTALFRDRVTAAIDAPVNRGLSVGVLFIDLDDFKIINDSLGHSAGDDLLVGISDRLRSCVRSVDAVARMGGDEFAVLVEELRSPDDALEIAARILSVIAEPLPLGAHSVVTAASIGIAIGVTGDRTDDLLRDADAAMYAAKAGGRGRYELFRPELHEAALRRLEIESQLRGAAGRGELVVEYQPVVDLGSGTVEALEALVRWNHPVRGLLAPNEFVAVAEESGLISEIGEFVLARACVEATGWSTSSDGPSVTVNLAPRQLLDAGIVDRVAEELARSGLAPHRLVLEVTEGALMQDPESARSRLEQLAALGVRLAMDDFGTGYSSLSHLQHFPIDILKIDRQFVATVLDDPGPALIHAVIELARALGIEPVAEGVESETQREALMALGCRLAQGSLYAMPLSAATAASLMAERRGLRTHADRIRDNIPV